MKSLMKLPLQKILDFLFGYDFFISYSHDDGDEYPNSLFKTLSEKYNYKVFLDTKEYKAGVDLQLATKRRVRMSKYLLLICKTNALKSEWVYKEALVCNSSNCEPIILDFNDTYKNIDDSNKLKQTFKNYLYVSEKKEKSPSTNTVLKLIDSFKGAKQEKKRTNILSLLIAVFVSISIFAIIQWNNSIKQTQNANHQLGVAYLEKAEQLISDKQYLNAAILAGMTIGNDYRNPIKGYKNSILLKKKSEQISRALEIIFNSARFRPIRRSSKLSIKNFKVLDNSKSKNNELLIYGDSIGLIDKKKGELTKTFNVPFVINSALWVSKDSICLNDTIGNFYIFSLSEGNIKKLKLQQSFNDVNLFNSDIINENIAFIYDSKVQILNLADQKVHVKLEVPGSSMLHYLDEENILIAHINEFGQDSVSILHNNEITHYSNYFDAFIRPQFSGGLYPSIISIEHSPNMDNIAFGCNDGTIRLYELNLMDNGEYKIVNEQVLWSSKSNGLFEDICFDNSGYSIAGVTEEGWLIQWHTYTGVVLNQMKAHSGIVKKVSFDDLGANIVTISEDGFIKKWSAFGYSNNIDFDCEISSIQTLNKKGKIFVFGETGEIYLLDGNNIDFRIDTIEHESYEGVYASYANPNQDLILAPIEYNNLLMINSNSKKIFKYEISKFDEIMNLIWQSDTTFLVCGISDTGDIFSNYRVTGDTIEEIGFFTSNIESLLYANQIQNNTMVTIVDSTVYKYDIDKNKYIDSTSISSDATCLSISHNGKYIALGFEDGLVEVHSYNNMNNLISTYALESSNEITSLVFSENDNLLAIGSYILGDIYKYSNIIYTEHGTEYARYHGLFVSEFGNNASINFYGNNDELVITALYGDLYVWRNNLIDYSKISQDYKIDDNSMDIIGNIDNPNNSFIY